LTKTKTDSGDRREHREGGILRAYSIIVITIQLFHNVNMEDQKNAHSHRYTRI